MSEINDHFEPNPNTSQQLLDFKHNKKSVAVRPAVCFANVLGAVELVPNANVTDHYELKFLRLAHDRWLQ